MTPETQMKIQRFKDRAYNVRTSTAGGVVSLLVFLATQAGIEIDAVEAAGAVTVVSAVVGKAIQWFKRKKG